MPPFTFTFTFTFTVEYAWPAAFLATPQSNTQQFVASGPTLGAKFKTGIRQFHLEQEGKTGKI